MGSAPILWVRALLRVDEFGKNCETTCVLQKQKRLL